MKRKIIRKFLCAALLLMSVVIYAQGPNPPPPPQPGLPIDGGLLMLLVVGAIFGAFMIYIFYNTRTTKKPL